MKRDIIATAIDRTFLPCLLITSSLALLPRINDFHYVAGGLIGDDGYAFANDAYKLGAASLWTPYSGYLFLYQRLIALIASYLPLELTPYIFFAAWLLSFFLFIFAVKSRGELLGLNRPMIYFLVCAISLQPSYVEAFFVFSSSHFFLGAALMLYVCVPAKEPTPVVATLLLLFVSLSGPFSAFATIVLLLQLPIFRDFPVRRHVYIVVPMCGLLQVLCMLALSRLNSATMNVSVMYVLQAILSLLLFGNNEKLIYISAGLFWTTSLALLIRLISQPGSRFECAKRLSPLFVALSAALLFLASVLLFSAAPIVPSPLSIGSRYFFIPYSLAFYSAIVCAQNHKWARFALVSSISVTCGASFVSVDIADAPSTARMYSRVDQQWIANAKFQKMKPDLIIPINPPWPIYPPLWNVQLNRARSHSNNVVPHSAPILLDWSKDLSMPASGGHEETPGATTPEAVRALYFDISKHCATSPYVAIEIDAWRSQMGWARLSWGESEDFGQERSMEKFYPSGSVVMQFAFHRRTSDHLIRLDPAEGVPDSQALQMLHSSANSSLRKSLSRNGVTIAHLTSPGGEFVIQKIHLYCLN